jgi:subtilisin family serine protease
MAKGMTLPGSLTSARFWRVLTILFIFLNVGQLLAQPRFRPDQILVQPKNATAAAKLAELQQRKKHEIAKKFPHLDDLQVVRIPKGSDPIAEANAYKASGLVDHAEPDYIYYASALPNDPSVVNGTLWAMQNLGQNSGKTDADIDATEAWNTTTSAQNIIVAVIDSGIRATHEDLAPNLWVNPLRE